MNLIFVPTRGVQYFVRISRADNPGQPELPVATAALPIAAPPVATTKWVITGKTKGIKSKIPENTIGIRSKITGKPTGISKITEKTREQDLKLLKKTRIKI